jgi:magnesium-transporting ATPase (P-type)
MEIANSDGTSAHDISRGEKIRVKPSDLTIGLTGDEARRRFASDGANSVADVAEHPVYRALKKLWSPISWMLEAAILMQLALGEYVEASAVAFLLVRSHLGMRI